MELRREPAGLRPVPELADLLTRGFAGYVVPLTFPPAVFARMVRVHGIDLYTSQVVLRGDVPVGLALLAHRGWTTRLAAMGIAPEARAAGVGRWFVEELLAEGRRRGDRRFTLEVIETNAPAVRLYQRVGFTVQRRLVGYLHPQPAGEPAEVEAVDVAEVARLLVQTGPADLPWQVTGETLALHGPPACGHRLGDAFAVVEPRDTQMELQGLVVHPRSRRRGQATRLLRALFARYPGKVWRIFARFPEELPWSLVEKLGFEPDPIRQLQMNRPLAPLSP